ncbi:MAG: peptidase S41 [Alphaproteobacteria bacterium]|nr:peptidase S41 [Alphaproteobacteria bacterium]
MFHDSKTLKAALVAACTLMSATVEATDERHVTPEELRQDLDQAASIFTSTHPEATWSVSEKALKDQIAHLKSEADHPMSLREAWKLFARLNPAFADAHAAVYYPDLKTRLQDHVNSGGAVLPITVWLDENRTPHLAASVTTQVNAQDAPVITAINGTDTKMIVNEMLSRAQGDSPAFRKAYVEKRFSDLHWELFGGSNEYTLTLKTKQGIRHVTVAGAHKVMRPTFPPLEDMVERRILEGDIGYLRVDAFVYPPEQEKAFFEFMAETWKQFHEAGVKDVIIDVRNNGGGTDHYWQLGIAPYVAQKSFPFLSYFKMRLTERNLKLGPIQGPKDSVQEGPFAMMVPIKEDEPNRIPGKAYILAGPYSYSSTILFLTAMQDSGEAIVAGQPTGGRSCSTGRIEKFALASTGIELTVPTLIYTRPAGAEGCMSPVQPDVLIETNPTTPEKDIAALATYIRKTNN